MRYFVIFGIYEKDDGEHFSTSMVYESKSFPSKEILEEEMKFKTFSSFKGITGLMEISEEDSKSWRSNS